MTQKNRRVPLQSGLQPVSAIGIAAAGRAGHFLSADVSKQVCHADSNGRLRWVSPQGRLRSISGVGRSSSRRGISPRRHAVITPHRPPCEPKKTRRVPRNEKRGRLSQLQTSEKIREKIGEENIRQKPTIARRYAGDIHHRRVFSSYFKIGSPLGGSVGHRPPPLFEWADLANLG